MKPCGHHPRQLAGVFFVCMHHMFLFRSCEKLQETRGVFVVSPNCTLHWAGFWELRQSPTRRTGYFTGEQGGFHTGTPTGLSRRFGQEFFHGRCHDYAFVNIENVVQKDVLVELVGGEVYITLFYIIGSVK